MGDGWFRRRALGALVAVAVATVSGTAVAEPPTPGFWSRLGRFFTPAPTERVVLDQRQSAYFDLVVEQDADNLRHLVFLPNHGSQTIIDPANPARPVSAYLKYMFLALPALGRPPERVLFIGLGGGIMPTILRRYFPEAAVDIVELDPVVVELAETYFYFRKDARTRIVLADGRAFLNRPGPRYDLIFLDTYNAEAIPFHLTTSEFYATMGARLAPGGIISVNSAELAKPEFNACEIRTIRAALPSLAVYRCEGNTNYIFLTAAGELPQDAELARRAELLDRQIQPGFALLPLVAQRLVEAEVARLAEAGTLLTDDFAPVHELDGAP